MSCELAHRRPVLESWDWQDGINDETGQKYIRKIYRMFCNECLTSWTEYSNWEPFEEENKGG